MDLQSIAFREAGPDDWAVDVPTEESSGVPRTPDEWDNDGWDAEAAGPKTLEQARTALAERVASSEAPDDDATAYDDLDDDDEPRGGTATPRGAGMWVPWLADAARSSGLPVVEVAGWRSRGHGPMRAVEGVVGHHTATGDAARGDYPSLNIVTNGRAGLPGPLCNFGLGRGGTVYVVAAGVGYHAGASRWAGFADLNDEFLGIEAEDNGDGRWTDAMLDAYPRLVAALLRYMRRGPDRYISHRGCAIPPGRKPDPGGLSDQWMRDQAARHLAGGAAPAPAAPRPVVEEDVVFIKCQPKGKGEMTALLSGPMFVGLVGDEAAGAQQLADKGHAALLWVTEATWNDLDRRSHNLCDSPQKVQNVTPPA
jgi:hypothetical protein